MPSPTVTGRSRLRASTLVISSLAVGLLILFVGIFAYQGGASQGAADTGQGPPGSADSESVPLDMSRRSRGSIPITR